MITVEISEDLLAKWIAAKAEHRKEVIKRGGLARQLKGQQKDGKLFLAYVLARQTCDEAHEQVLAVERKINAAVVEKLEQQFPQ
jgi:hypothetical protein